MTETSTPAGPLVADRMAAIVFIVIAQVEIWVLTLHGGPGIGTRVLASVSTAIASSALAWRRTRPVAAYWINTAAVLATIAAGYPSNVYQWTNLVAVYSIAAYGTRTQRWLTLPGVVGGPLLYFLRFPSEGSMVVAGFIVALWLVGWLIGRIYGARLDAIRLREERDLTARLVEANEQRLVLEEERTRIARELHDIIGHTVNVMVVHAGAGRREIGGDPQRVRQAFDTIERTGRAALGELDRVLAILRRDEVGSEHGPTPGLGDLDDLVATAADTGLTVQFDLTGGTDEVPASVSLAAYRIVQEALTNTIRHGEAARVSVLVVAGPGRIDLTVADDGRGDPTTLTPGRGVAGMRERAAIHDGSVTFDRAEAGGVEVRAWLRWKATP